MTMKARDPNKFKRSLRTKYRMIPERTTVPAKMPFGTIGSNDSRYTLYVHTVGVYELDSSNLVVRPNKPY